MYTLVIIDMMSYFLEDLSEKKADAIISGCQKEIRKAIKKTHPILFLEYEGLGYTVSSLLQLTEKYKHQHTITKYDDDGSHEIMSACLKYRFPYSFRVCGINTDYCVKDTVTGLSTYSKVKKVEVIESACGSTISHPDGISHMKELSKVIIRGRKYD